MPKVASLIACSDGRVFLLRVAASLILLVVCRIVFVDLESADGEVNAMIGAGVDSSAGIRKVVMVAVGIMVTVSKAVGSSGWAVALGLFVCCGRNVWVEMLKGDVRFVGSLFAKMRIVTYRRRTSPILVTVTKPSEKSTHLFATDPSPTKPQPQSSGIRSSNTTTKKQRFISISFQKKHLTTGVV
eukprot:scaffold10022_cov156-Skeletonema_marinoi.AAC.28